jgi:plasmid stabilization system protein ParE
VLWHGHAIAVHVTSLVPEAGVDTPEDLLRVRKHFEARPTVPWCKASPHSDVKTGAIRHDPAQGWPVPLAVSSLSS